MVLKRACEEDLGNSHIVFLDLHHTDMIIDALYLFACTCFPGKVGACFSELFSKAVKLC